MSNGSKNKTVPSPHPDLELQHGVSLSEFVLEYFPKYGDAVALVRMFMFFLLSFNWRP